MKRLSLKFLSILLILAVHQSACAGIEFQEVLSYTIPGFETVVPEGFADVDGDAVPEVLARSGDKIVVFSGTGDSVLFEASIDTAYDRMFNFTDINGDSIPDIAIAYSYPIKELSDTAFAIDFFDGDVNYSQSRYYYSNTGYNIGGACFARFHGPGILTVLKALDIDSDGKMEFIFSHRHYMRISPDCGFHIEETIRGLSYIYKSFPDSMLWTGTYHISDPKLCVINGDTFLMTNYHTYSDFWYVGSSYMPEPTIRNKGILCYDPYVNKANILDEAWPYSCSYFSDKDISKSLTPLCFGDIDLTCAQTEMIARFSWSVDCERFDGAIDSRGSQLRMYRLITPDSIELVWYREYEYDINFIYFPCNPGYYFAFRGDAFVQFNGSDGSEVQSTSEIPTGKRKWDYPFGNNQPYMVITNGNEIAIYKPAVVTAADEGDEIPIPAKLSLGNPYPNPFNSSQTITVKASPGDILTVDVYNLLGQKIESIHNARVTGPDEIKIVWEPGEIPTGIYFIKAFTQDQATVVKSILLK